LTIGHVLSAARDGDAFALSLIHAVGRVQGWVAHQLDQLFDPQRIIFAGPLADLGDVFLAPVRETARQLADAGREPAIVNSALGLYNGAVGAAALAMHHWRPKR
jgi:predicted NBD/HSP70 family sugar kinase